MTEEELLASLAEKHKTTPAEVRQELETMIDEFWYKRDGSSDTEEFKRLRLLIGHKPSIMEFVNFCGEEVEKNREKKPWYLRRLF